MKIIVVGCGKVGYTIAKSLSVEPHVDLTIIDNKQEPFEKAAQSIDAMLVRGNGLSANTLIEAGAREADLIISVTDADDTNLLCCILARHLGAKHTIARVRDPEYALYQNRLWKELGLDRIINPEQETAREISRLLRFPTADDIDIFVGGRVELVSFKVSEAEDSFVGKSVAQVFHKKKSGVLLAMIERDGVALIPNGDLILAKHDVIRIIGRPSGIMDFFTLAGKSAERIKNAVIIGGGKITHYLVELLQRHSSGTSIRLVELEQEKCETLSETFPRCLIIHGDGTDQDVLTSVTDDRAGAIICLTDRDEENTVIALYARQLGLRKVILKINHINQNMVKDLGLGSIVSPKNITSDQMLRYVRGLTGATGGHIRTVYTIFEDGDDRVEAVELIVTKKSRCLDVPLKDIRCKKGVLIGCIVRNANIIIPTGQSSIQMGDIVIIIAKNGNILELDDILAN